MCRLPLLIGEPRYQLSSRYVRISGKSVRNSRIYVRLDHIYVRNCPNSVRFKEVLVQKGKFGLSLCWRCFPQ